MATLTWERRDGQRMVFHLQAMETAIGRDLGNQIRIESGYVSKRHAVVRLGQQGYSIADLNSSNGTSVNGQRATLALLKDGDRIELGAEVLTFSNPVAGVQPGADTPSRKPLMIAVIGGGGVLIILVLLLIIGGGSSSPPAGPSQGPSAAPTATGTAAPGPVTGQQPAPAPPVQQAPAFPPVGAPGEGAAPAVTGPLPSNDPAALYEMAMAHVKGRRFVEARRLLQAALQFDPGNASAQQRLREVDATIQMEADQHMAAGQRAFTYLRYEDAIFEWEQVISTIAPADPRYQQAAAGIRRARERLGQKDD